MVLHPRPAHDREILRAHGYEGSECAVRRRPAEGVRPPVVRPAQQTGYASGPSSPGRPGRDGEPPARPGPRAASFEIAVIAIHA